MNSCSLTICFARIVAFKLWAETTSTCVWTSTQNVAYQTVLYINFKYPSAWFLGTRRGCEWYKYLHCPSSFWKPFGLLFLLRVNTDLICNSFKNTFVLILDSGQASGLTVEQNSTHTLKTFTHFDRVRWRVCLYGSWVCAVILCQTTRTSCKCSEFQHTPNSKSFLKEASSGDVSDCNQLKTPRLSPPGSSMKEKLQPQVFLELKTDELHCWVWIYLPSTKASRRMLMYSFGTN